MTGRESLTTRLAAAARIVVGNAWAAQHQLDHAAAAAVTGSYDHLGVGRFLVDQGVLTRDQAADLDEVLKHQGHFPEYRLRRKIGSGGMGTVFLADHLASGRQVALKTMNARLEDSRDFIGRFHREAKALAQVKHPNIAEILGSGEHDRHCWLAMEFIDGPSLMHLLRDYRVLPEAYALRITRQIAEGLGHVWATAQLVHRDIKPENILVVRRRNGDGNLFPDDDTAKLIDFGLVKAEDKDERLTQTGMTIGTPLYMSPEQVRGERLDCRSDIYGLGATLYHLLTGLTPFSGTSPGAIMSAHLTEAVPDPGERVPSLAKETRELVMMAMAKDPDRRFLTAEGLVKAIDRSLEARGGKGGGSMRLLRKPLVLNKPQPRRTGSGRIPASPAGSPVEDTVVQPGTDIRPGSTRAMRPGEAVATAVPQPPGPALEPLRPPSGRQTRDRSRVFDEDPQAAHGVGVLPWIVLAFALVGLGLWWWLS